jgi:magnesium transporter
MEEEVTEDMYRLAGVEVPDVDYPQVSLWEIYKKRILWLTLLFLSESLTSTVILHYEEFLARVTTLAAYIPLLIGTGGNVGSQISTLVVRGMATGKVPIASFQKILIKEVLTGLALGSTMGIYMWLRITTFRHTPEIAITVGLAMTAIAFFANLVGSSLPFLFRLLKVDPAVTSSPFIATLMDVIGLLIYFQIAHWILHL